jgi:integrase
MVGLAQSDSPLDEKQRLFEIAHGLLQDIRELEGKAESLGKDRNLPTVRQWFNRRLDEVKTGSDGDDRHLKASSLARIENVHGRWLAHLEGLPVNLADSPLNRIGPDEVRSFLSAGKLQGLSGATRHYALARIRAVFGRAVDQGLLTSNPASVKRVGRLKFDNKSIRRAFNPQQIAAILNAAQASPHRWLKLSALLGLFTGQRAGDICSMRWEDIHNLDSALPTIRIVQQKKGSVVTVPIAGPLQQALRSVPEAERNGFLLGHIAEAYLSGRRRRFIRAWRMLLENVKLPTLVDAPVVAKVERSGDMGRTRYAWTFHSWRHTTATYLSGPDAHYLLGHRSEGERSLGQTAEYRHEDLQRLKVQLDSIPLSQAENILPLTVNA